jgi:hypothetical protein
MPLVDAMAVQSFMRRFDATPAPASRAVGDASLDLGG